MKVMIPFYYAMIALLFGMLGGFCARCYQISKGKNFSYVLKAAALNFIVTSLTVMFLPILVVLSNTFRKLLLCVLIYEAEEDYTISLSDTDKASLIDVLLERASLYGIMKIAISLSLFCFINLDSIASATIRSVAEESSSETMKFNLGVKFFGRDFSFYKSNSFAKKLFCL